MTNNRLIRIGDDEFNLDNDLSIQTSIGSHTTVYTSMDISKYPSYEDYFSNLYENSISFTLSNAKLVSHNSVIKSIDVSFNNKMNLTIRCEFLYIKDESEMRDEKIDEILINNK